MMIGDSGIARIIKTKLYKAREIINQYQSRSFTPSSSRFTSLKVPLQCHVVRRPLSSTDQVEGPST